MYLLETQGEAFIFGPQQITYGKRGTAQETALETRPQTKRQKSFSSNFNSNKICKNCSVKKNIDCLDLS